MKTHAAVVAASLILTVAAANAVDLSEGTAASAREARRDSRDLRIFGLVPAAKKASIGLALGLAYDKDEANTRTTNTPFSIDYQTADPDWWKVQIRGDGYARVASSGSSTLSGIADLNLSLLHPLAEGLVGAVGLKLPTHGDVGSSSGGQSLKLAYSGSMVGPWSYVVLGAVKRANSSQSGTSRFSQTLYAEIDYAIDSSHTLLAGLSRTNRRGVGGSTELAIEYDFPLTSTVGAAASVGRGLTSGARHTSVEFDLTYRF